MTHGTIVTRDTAGLWVHCSCGYDIGCVCTVKQIASLQVKSDRHMDSMRVAAA